MYLLLNLDSKEYGMWHLETTPIDWFYNSEERFNKMAEAYRNSQDVKE